MVDNKYSGMIDLMHKFYETHFVTFYFSVCHVKIEIRPVLPKGLKSKNEFPTGLTAQIRVKVLAFFVKVSFKVTKPNLHSLLNWVFVLLVTVFHFFLKSKLFIRD